jgi:two-component system sensor histidine kinase/response regulator
MLTILVADDEFAVLEVLSMALESEGHRVLKAGDGADALRVLVSQPCDLLLCDESMPVMTGSQLVHAMRADPKLAGVPVILMADVFRRPAASLDGIQVLPKPIMLPQLYALVDEVRARKAGSR